MYLSDDFEADVLGEQRDSVKYLDGYFRELVEKRHDAGLNYEGEPQE